MTGNKWLALIVLTILVVITGFMAVGSLKGGPVKLSGHFETITDSTGALTPKEKEKFSIFEAFLNARRQVSRFAVRFLNQAESTVETVFSNLSPSDWEEKARKCGFGQVYKEVDRKWGSLIRAESRQYGVNAALVIAIICKESGGNQDAVNLASETGAWGLMQILLSTAQLYQSGITSEDLLDPELNIHIGVQRLAKAKESMGDDPGAIFAYHWGETGGREKLQAYGQSADQSDDWQFVRAIIRVAEEG